MPVKVVNKGGTYRVVEAHTGRVAKNAAGTPVDGGGHSIKAKAEGQARAINMNRHGKS